MKRLSVFVAGVALALLPITAARAAPGGLSVGCGPASDVANSTGLALVETSEPIATEAATAIVHQPVQDEGVDVHLSEHDVLLILGTALVVLLLIIIF